MHGGGAPCAHRRCAVRWGRCSSVRSTSAVRSSNRRGNPVTQGLVAVLTEGLRLAGVGQAEFEEMADSPPPRPLRRGDVGGVLSRIRRDYVQNAYIVTGVIDDAIYDEDCTFTDPTISFSGLRLWKRNLQLLVPFLISPSVDLLRLKNLGRSEDGDVELLAEWKLETTLSLPWRPLISILGTTKYTLNDDSNKVVQHVETWNVSGGEALLQMLRPGPPQGVKAD